MTFDAATIETLIANAKRNDLLGKNAKVKKNESEGALTASLQLSPSDEAGINTCPMASKGCSEKCLKTAGRNKFDGAKLSRIGKTRWLFSDRQGFLGKFHHELDLLEGRARRQKLTPACRPNTLSDLSWERLGVPQAHPGIQFYDYTKRADRALASLGKDWPSNYHLTFSRSEDNESACLAHLRAGGNVAVVFGGAMPATWHGYRVINGDSSDWRPGDPRNVVVGLTPKGEAKHDRSGFVVWNWTE